MGPWNKQKFIKVAICNGVQPMSCINCPSLYIGSDNHNASDWPLLAGATFQIWDAEFKK